MENSCTFVDLERAESVLYRRITAELSFTSREMHRMTNGNHFVEIAAILGLATLFGVIGQKLRQPLIIMFLATGILAGPSGLGIIHS